MTGPTHIAFANAGLLAGAAFYNWEVPTGALVSQVFDLDDGFT